MSQEKIEAVRRIYSERARGDFTGGRKLFAEEAVIRWEIPEGRTVSSGRKKIGRNFRSFLIPWESFVIEADEFIELDERSILVVGECAEGGTRAALTSRRARS